MKALEWKEQTINLGGTSNQATYKLDDDTREEEMYRNRKLVEYMY